MSTITLKQASSYMSNKVHTMTAKTPAGTVTLTGITGGGISFNCTNPIASVNGAKSVTITYDGSVPAANQHQTISVSSVLP